METRRIPFLVVAILVSFLLFSSPSSIFNVNAHGVSTTVNDFCTKNKNTKFCIQAFESDPRSATAKDMVTLLKICVDSAVANAKKTHQLLSGYSYTPKNLALKPVVSTCISAFDGYLSMLKGVVGEFKADPQTASYDGMLALAELNPCNDSLKESKVTESEIHSTFQTASQYCMLCVDVASAGGKKP